MKGQHLKTLLKLRSTKETHKKRSSKATLEQNFSALCRRSNGGEEAGKKSMPKDNMRPCSGTSSLRLLLSRPRPSENFVQESNIILGSHTFSEFHSTPGQHTVHDVLHVLEERDRISSLIVSRSL